MRFRISAVLLMCLIVIFVTTVIARESEQEEHGEVLFKKHCVMCHPDGENIINPQKTLHAKDLRASGIAKKQDIVNIMRNPGPGMPKYDRDQISDELAEEIAEYILKTFK